MNRASTRVVAGRSPVRCRATRPRFIAPLQGWLPGVAPFVAARRGRACVLSAFSGRADKRICARRAIGLRHQPGGFSQGGKLVACFLKLVARISKSEPLILKSKPLIFRPPETRPAGAGNQWPFGRISVCLRVPKMRTKRRHAPREHYVKANTTYNIRLPVYHPYIIMCIRRGGQAGGSK